MGRCDRRVGAAWRHTPVIHDDPDRRPTRSPLPSLGHRKCCAAGFGKGTPLIAAKPLSWVSPCLTSCCLFSFLWTCRRSGVSSPYGGLAPVCLRCCGCIPAWSLSMSLLCGHVGRRRGTHSTMIGPWYTAGANGGATLLGTMVPARLCVCQSRSSNPHCSPQMVGRVGRMRVRPFDIHLWVCVVAVMGRCDRWFGTSWLHPIGT